MNLLFHCPWSSKNLWLKSVKKYFKNQNIYTLNDNPNLSKIDFAIIWDLPNEILDKMQNVKVLFSPGAGVDHILSLPSYKGQSIIRVKSNAMAERMMNHVLSQILYYQLNLKKYYEAQKQQTWIDEIEPVLNKKITIGILGLGFLGSFVANKLDKNGYNVLGFKNSKSKKKYSFKVYYKKKDLKKFINKCNIIVNILPLTNDTKEIINKKFLINMKKKSLFINVGRGLTVNEQDLIFHLKRNKEFYASLDVFNNEPLSNSNPLWNLENVLITPHVASLTVIDDAIEHIYMKFLEFKKNGKIKNEVNIKKGY
ncbi:MAG: Glyoxylate/hydroxypyruvate reductase A [Alphaproteobacteria bacterium MarineAlpha5_Bin6]|nr:MAG: Glyoxylate/hydroxypyruvate reductase A [Alphaproteobacteria bacterium MarineAlpha5_Bin6]|tara:strand:+ start:1050 stop:1982 length:933 start_codon:yes stop_codon:yes gene_type:complete